MGNYNKETVFINRYSNIPLRNKSTLNPIQCRIFSKKEQKNLLFDYKNIATDGKNIFFESKLFNSREFFKKFPYKKLIVLTSKEKELLKDISSEFNITIDVFEILFPVFNKISYQSPQRNHQNLLSSIKKLKNLNVKGKSLGHFFCSNHIHKIERKIKRKTNLDNLFFYGTRSGYSEVFKLKEERKERSIIAFDFNSMYASCLDTPFMDPKSTFHIINDLDSKKIENFSNGFFRVILSHPKNTFFKTFHPFKYKNLTKSFYFRLEEQQKIEIWLFKNEIEYYKKFFSSYSIKEAIISSKEIHHPLLRDSKKIYTSRLKNIKNGDKLQQNLNKFQLVTIHSSTSSRKYKRFFFQTSEELRIYLLKEFHISFPINTDIPRICYDLKSCKDLKFGQIKDMHFLEHINPSHASNVHSLTAQILASANIKIVKTIELFLSHKDVEICYSNIDSLHISLPTNKVQYFLNSINHLISEDIGYLKIQSICNKGYWFDPGRYWLFENERLVQFKNKLFKRPENKSKPFISKRVIKRQHKIGQFRFIQDKVLHINDTFSYCKKINLQQELDNINFERYTFSEIKDLNVAGASYAKEILQSKALKVRLFQKIATE